MSEDACEPPAGLRPLNPQLPVEVQEWACELRMIWAAVGLTMNQFACMHGPINKGTISRYLYGLRVPRDTWFLEKLLAILDDRGEPATAARHEHLTQLQLRALQVAHPHEYRVRLISDELKRAVTAKLEAERFASALEEQLVERGQAGERLTQEISEITGQMHRARERAGQAEQHCRQLEERLDYLDAYRTGEDSAGARLEAREEFTNAQRAKARGPEFGWITSVGPGFRITAPSRPICSLLDLRYEELNGSYLLEDPLRGRLQMMLGNFGEWALIIGMLTNSALDGWRSDPGYPHCAAKVVSFFDWLNGYVKENYEDVAEQVERAPILLVDGDSSRNDLRLCLAAAVGEAEWPPFNANRHNSMRLHVVNHPLLSGEVARFNKSAIPLYKGSQIIAYDVTWNAECADKIANRLMASVLAELGMICEDTTTDT